MAVLPADSSLNSEYLSSNITMTLKLDGLRPPRSQASCFLLALFCSSFFISNVYSADGDYCNDRNAAAASSNSATGSSPSASSRNTADGSASWETGEHGYYTSVVTKDQVRAAFNSDEGDFVAAFAGQGVTVTFPNHPRELGFTIAGFGPPGDSPYDSRMLTLEKDGVVRFAHVQRGGHMVVGKSPKDPLRGYGLNEREQAVFQHLLEEIAQGKLPNYERFNAEVVEATLTKLFEKEESKPNKVREVLGEINIRLMSMGTSERPVVQLTVADRFHDLNDPSLWIRMYHYGHRNGNTFHTLIREFQIEKGEGAQSRHDSLGQALDGQANGTWSTASDPQIQLLHQRLLDGLVSQSETAMSSAEKRSLLGEENAPSRRTKGIVSPELSVQLMAHGWRLEPSPNSAYGNDYTLISIWDPADNHSFRVDITGEGPLLQFATESEP